MVNKLGRLDPAPAFRVALKWKTRAHGLVPREENIWFTEFKGYIGKLDPRREP